MKSHFVAILVVVSSAAFAQNKTLGVGVVTPNTNAALHVESPTNNQGFIMPRLSTVQRNAMTLGAPDDGLMVYDMNARKIYIWDGSGWQPGTGLNFPFTANDGSATTSFSLTNTNSGSAGYFALTNVANGSPSLSAYTAGTGYALSVTVNNPSNSFPALNIDHNGTGNAITANRPIQATQFIGDGSLLTNLPSSGWSRTGNASTNPATDFIGTTDSQPVVFKSNNVEGMRIYPSGQVGVGSVPAAAKLAVGSLTQTLGVYGDIQTNSVGQNKGVWGNASGSTTQNFGVYGSADLAGSNGAIGVYGEGVGAGSADAFGLYGVTNSFTATTGTTYGVFASAVNGTTNWAGFFQDGNVHITNSLSVGSPGTFGSNGQVLTSQGPGLPPIWSATGASGWSLSGNTGTNPANDFIGTSDNTDFSIRTNNLQRINVNKGGYIGINTMPGGTSQIEVTTANTFSALLASTTYSNSSGQNRGLQVSASNSTLGNFGVYAAGISGASDGVGVYGEGVGTGPNTYGVLASGLGTGSTNYGAYATATTAAATNYGIFASAQSGTTNWAGFFNDGNVHISNSLSVGSPGTFGANGEVLTSQGPGLPPIWTTSGGLSVGSVTSTEIADATISSEDLSPTMNITTSGNISATAFIGDGSGLSNLSYWHFSGNSISGSEFIGTTNDQPLLFKQNNQPAGLIGTTASQNTFLGYQSGLNHTGTQTTAVGYRALFSNSTGAGNTAVGFETIFSGTSSNWNTAVGWHALSINGAGNANTGIGYNANGSNASGSNNTAIGYNALTSNTSGLNTAVGSQALLNNTTGTSNTALGANADVSSSNLTNATAIGANAIVGTNNTIMLGSAGTYVAVGGSVPQGMLSVSHNGLADPAGNFGVTNANNGDAAISATTLGTGYAGDFSNQNAANANAVVSITNFGAGPSLFASTYVSASRYVASSGNSSSNVDIIQSGTGGAGTFQISNSTNATSSLLATTNGDGSGMIVNVTKVANTQPGIEINHNGTNAIGLSMNGGSLKYSVQTYNAPPMSIKAGVYRITGTGTYTLPSAIDGETCLVYNNSGVALSGDLSAVANGTVRQFVFIAGAWRIVN